MSKWPVLFRQEGEGDDRGWVAQVLPVDIASQGHTKREALERLLWGIAAQAVLDCEHGKVPFSDLPKAPQPYWDEYRKKYPEDAP